MMEWSQDHVGLLFGWAKWNQLSMCIEFQWMSISSCIRFEPMHPARRTIQERRLWCRNSSNTHPSDGIHLSAPPPFQWKVRLPVQEEWICIKCFFLCHLSNIHSLRNRWKQTNGYRLSEAFVATDRIKMGSSEACSSISTEKCCLVSLGVTSYGRV